MPRTLLAVIAAAALFAACDLAPKDPDEEYLRAFCTATSAFSDDLVTATSPDAIQRTIADYREALIPLEPADDLRGFHQEYLNYLADTFNSPGALDGDPPEPPSRTLLRLNALARSIDECDDTTLFGR